MARSDAVYDTPSNPTITFAVRVAPHTFSIPPRKVQRVWEGYTLWQVRCTGIKEARYNDWMRAANWSLDFIRYVVTTRTLLVELYPAWIMTAHSAAPLQLGLVRSCVQTNTGLGALDALQKFASLVGGIHRERGKRQRIKRFSLQRPSEEEERHRGQFMISSKKQMELFRESLRKGGPGKHWFFGRAH